MRVGICETRLLIDTERHKFCHVFAGKLNVSIPNILIFFVFKQPRLINCLLTVFFECSRSLLLFGFDIRSEIGLRRT